MGGDFVATINGERRHRNPTTAGAGVERPDFVFAKVFDELEAESRFYFLAIEISCEGAVN